jgi:UDP-N-acetylglucosamine diphosphorylase / glucose-1-phosphate thymidylyltransferase / UDP-N-acetylgalactosamine diphosphorylase / glucosamine-1-phosphate N-acetyltransferase / galactosamine-1-phosphate N-acetyltransferase
VNLFEVSMQAVILAAGKGSRLHPITTKRSKAMLPILGKPIVERVMEHLAINGIGDFILVVSPDDYQITRYFRRESGLEADVRFVYQPQRLGMADALRCAAPLIDADFILSACDNLTSPQHVANLLAAWRQPPCPSAILTLMTIPPELVPASGVVALEGDTVVSIVEKPRLQDAPSYIASLPLYCLPHSILEYLPEVQPSPRGEYELQDAIQLLIQRHGHVRGVMIASRLTLTSPADLLQINRHFLMQGNDMPQIQPQSVGAGTQLTTPLHIDAGVQIGAGCRIGPNVYIERDCRIGDGAAIRDAILLRECVVPALADIHDQVVS